MNWDTNFFAKRVLIELTDHCNLNCIMCSCRKQPHGIPPGFMDVALFKQILDEVDLSKGWSLELFWLGESLLHPKFNEILRITRERVKNTESKVNIHTNATIFNKEKQDLILEFGEKFPWITFSIDAINPESYKKIRGGDLEPVNKNIKEFLLNRKSRNQVSPRATLQFIIMKENATEVENFVQYWKKFYEDNNLKTQDNLFFKRLEVHDIEKQKLANELFDKTIVDLNLFSKQDERISIISMDKPKEKAFWFEEKTERRVCAAPFKNPVIRWDGEMTVCCFDERFLYSIGNLKDSSFKELWYGEKMNQFREKHINKKFDELLTKDGWAKCKQCIGYYFPTISDEEVALYKQVFKL